MSKTPNKTIVKTQLEMRMSS